MALAPMRRVWSELVPPARLREARVLDALAARHMGLLVAVRPGEGPAIAEVVRAARDSGVWIGLWPMLEDADGRWLNVRNTGAFSAMLARLLDGLEAAEARPDEVAFDLEPDIREVRRAVHGSPRVLARWLRRGGDPEATAAIARMVDEVRGRGMASFAAVAPPVLWDRPATTAGPWQRRLGTPVDGAGFDRVSVMLYSSLLEGYLPLLRRPQARWLLGRACRAARERFGERASVSLGLSGGGALGDERSYRSEGELAEDVAIARAAGVEDIALHGLAGALARAPLARWLDVLSRG